MNPMKKIFASIAIASTAALVLAGCTSGAGDSGSVDASSKGAVAMSFAGLDIQIWNDMLPMMEEVVTEAGYDFVTDDPKWNAQTQVQDWESWIVRGDIKAITGYPVQSDAMIAVTQQANDMGIPVLGYGSTWDGVAAAVVFDHKKDGFAAGEEAAKWIKEKYGDEKVDVGFLGYPDTDLGRLRGEGMMEALDQANLNLNINEHSVLNLDDGYAAVQNQLNAFPNTKVWLAIAGDPAMGAYQALTDSGVSPTDDSILLGNLDVTDTELEVIGQEGSFWRFSFGTNSRELAGSIANMMVAAANGEPVSDEVVDVRLITSENADDYLLANQ